MCYAVIIVPFYWPEYFLLYLVLLIFLGFGLKPLLEKTGLFAFYQNLLVRFSDRRYRGVNAKRMVEIERKERDDKYRRSRIKDPKLPKNW